MGFFEKLKNGLKKTKDSMMGRIESLLHSFNKIDEDLFEELNFENMPNDIHLSMRTPVKTLGDSKETMQENYDKAFKVFKRIVDDMTEKAVEAGDKGLTTEPVHYDDSSLESSDSTESSENK